eukprot:1154264-Pelagomonas_calceolata.AAC.1
MTSTTVAEETPPTSIKGKEIHWLNRAKHPAPGPVCGHALLNVHGVDAQACQLVAGQGLIREGRGKKKKRKSSRQPKRKEKEGKEKEREGKGYIAVPEKERKGKERKEKLCRQKDLSLRLAC